MRRIALTVLALAGAPALAQSSAPAISIDTLKDVTKTLSSDAFEGRAPTTPAEAKATGYIVERMKAAGLKPGNNGSWFQNVPLVELTAGGVTPMTFTGGKTPVSLTYRTDMVLATYRVTPKVDIQNSDVVFVGYGINAPEKGWNDYAGIDVKGKTVVVLVNDPDWETPGKNGLFEGKAMTYYGRWTYKFEEAARQGAAGLLIVHETDPASYGWATVKNSNTNTMFDIVRDQPAAVHPQLEGWIQRDLAVDLFKRAGLDFDALKQQAQTRGFKPVVLKGETFSADYPVDAKVITSQNIVGRIDGSQRPDETVNYSAHWDHLGVGQPDAKGDRIYNGAVDNATGI
ncbi:MAG: M28 family metallopeptidase, partial [Sphingomonas sp.]